MAKISDVDNSSLLFTEGSAPTTPATSKWRVYFKTDGLYVIDDAGTETGPLAASSGSGGVMLQQVRARITTSPTDTTGSFVTSGLSVAITPSSASSIIEVAVDGEIGIDETASTGDPRFARVRIQNTTAATTLCDAYRGRRLVAASSATAEGRYPIALRGYETAGSTSARTYRFEFCTGTATDTATVIGSRAGGVIITAAEISS